MNLLISLVLPALIAGTTIDLDSRIQSDLDAAINSLLHANAFTHFHADGHCGPAFGNHGCDPSSIKTCCTPAGTCEVTVWMESQCVGEGFHDHADHAKCRGGERYERPQFYDPAVEFPCAHRDVRADQTYNNPTHDASTYFDAPINEGKKQTVELQSLLAAYKQRKIASALEGSSGGAAAIAELTSLGKKAEEAAIRLAEQKKSMGIETSHTDFIDFVERSPAHLNALHAALGAEDEDVYAVLRGLSPKALPKFEMGTITDRSGARLVGIFEIYDPARGKGWEMTLRQFEIFETLRRNIRGGVFDEIHLFHEKVHDHMKDLEWPTNEYTTVTWHEVEDPNGDPFKEGRLTFKRVMQWANMHLPDGTIAIFGNSDISFDDTLHLARRNNDMVDAGSLMNWKGPESGTKEPVAWSWTRLEIGVDGFPRYILGNWNGATIGLNPWATDAWAVMTPIKVPEESDFYFGVMGCDEAIAALFKDTKWPHGDGSGNSYNLQNPSMTIYAYHMHRARWGFASTRAASVNEVRESKHYHNGNSIPMLRGGPQGGIRQLYHNGNPIPPPHPPRRTGKRVPSAYAKWMHDAADPIEAVRNCPFLFLSHNFLDLTR